MPRSRKPENEDLPDNVYVTLSGKHCYFRWIHPKLGTVQPLGKDRSTAIQAGEELNRGLLRRGINPHKREIQKAITIGRAIKDTQSRILKKYRGSTKTNYQGHLNRMDREIGHYPLTTPLQTLSAWFYPLPDSRPGRCESDCHNCARCKPGTRGWCAVFRAEPEGECREFILQE